MLAACGARAVGGDDGKQIKRVLVLGDSNGAAEDGWVVQLQSIRPELQLFNTSIPGNTIGFDNLGNRRLNTLRNLDARVAAARDSLGAIDAAIVALGTNDAKAVFDGRHAEVIRKLDTLLTRLEPVVGQRVVLVTPPPYGADSTLASKYQGGAGRVARFATAYDSVARARSIPLADVHAAFADDFPEQTKDGVHLRTSGQRRIAENVSEAMARLSTAVKREGE